MSWNKKRVLITIDEDLHKEVKENMGEYDKFSRIVGWLLEEWLSGKKKNK